MKLNPLCLWRENPHFAKTKIYREVVFGVEGAASNNHNSNNNARRRRQAPKRFKRGQFIEDTFGQEMIYNIKDKGMEAFQEYDTYLLDMGEGVSCSYHMDGPR